MIRVLVAEDSAVVGELLVHLLNSDPEIEVVGLARNGLEAVEMAARLRPDIITMDIRMPRLNGFEATRHIMQQTPTPILVVSASVEAEDMKITFNAIKAGALAVVEKPEGRTHRSYQAIAQDLIDKVKVLSQVKVVRRHPDLALPPARSTVWERRSAALPELPDRSAERKKGPTRPQVVAIGSSTGGPAALYALLEHLPADFPLPLLIVQHIAQGFVQGFVEWLNTAGPMRVKLAAQGENIRGETAYVGPDGYHLQVRRDGTIHLNDALPVKGHRPSATLLFESVAKAYGPAAIGVILTGMGDDGAFGLKVLHDVGGQVIAQDEGTSVVFGMPQAAIALGAVDHVVPLEQIADTIVRLVQAVKPRT